MQQCDELRKAFEADDVAAHHAFIRSSLLLVYSDVTDPNPNPNPSPNPALTLTPTPTLTSTLTLTLNLNPDPNPLQRTR